MNTKLFRTSLLACLSLTALLVFLPRQAHAASSCTASNSNGKYNWTTVVWSCGHVPGIGLNVGDDVTIPNTVMVKLDTDVTIGNFTNNPFEFDTPDAARPAIAPLPRGELQAIDIEFEGVEQHA